MDREGLRMKRGWMKIVSGRLGALLRDEDGPTGTEYAIMLAVLILGCVTIVQSIGESMETIYDNITDAVGSVGNA